MTLGYNSLSNNCLTLGLIHNKTSAGRGRCATLWAKVHNPATDTSTAEPDPYGA
jgi:hypothetical protein